MSEGDGSFGESYQSYTERKAGRRKVNMSGRKEEREKRNPDCRFGWSMDSCEHQPIFFPLRQQSLPSASAIISSD